jgi:hypothetical protein
VVYGSAVKMILSPPWKRISPMREPSSRSSAHPSPQASSIFVVAMLVELDGIVIAAAGGRAG